MDRPYATPEGVRAYLTSLAGLHALREDRRAAGARFERMPEFCVIGAYVLTGDGRFGELIGVSARSVKDLADVVPLEEFDQRGRRIHGEGWRMTYRTPAPLAPYEGLCPECGRGWTYFERSDVVEAREVRTVLFEEEAADVLVIRNLHTRCHAAENARDALWRAEDAFDRAGFRDAAPEPMPIAPSDGFGAWFRLETARGGIRFGRRGPGYGLEWHETGQDLTGTFCRIENLSPLGPIWNEPPVPHGPFHVDPKDESYLILYLRRLRETLGL